MGQGPWERAAWGRDLAATEEPEATGTAGSELVAEARWEVPTASEVGEEAAVAAREAQGAKAVGMGGAEQERRGCQRRG